MHRYIVGALAMALSAAVSVPAVQADSISGVVGARAKERAGAYLTEQDIEKLERYNGNVQPPAYGYSGTYAYGGGYPYAGGYAYDTGYPYDYDYGYTPGLSVGVGIGY